MLKPRRRSFGVAMSGTSWLWALFTVIAAASQTVRNAAQRELTATLGTIGATHVRFLFGFPFALVFLVVVLVATGVPLPSPSAVFCAWVVDGALAQMAATGLMLAAMNDRSFVAVYAYIKTEPVQAATFTMVIGLTIQVALLSPYLLLRNPAVMRAILRAWRPSMLAGFLGAFASQSWFLAFALATAASVRTLALVEVLFAQAISAFVFKQPTSPREAVGIVLIVAGVALLVWAH